MAVKQLKLKINLDKMFGERFPNDSSLRGEVGQAIIDRIVARTQRFKDVEGSAFAKYTKEYAARKGVGRTKVDLTLDGDMFDALDIVSETPRTITLGFDDELENKKAFNHNTGDTLPKREFFGITEDEKDKIARKFFKAMKKSKKEIKEAGKSSREEFDEELQQSGEELFSAEDET